MTKQQLMTEDEIDFRMDIVFGKLKKEGYEILSVNTYRTMNPQIVAKKNGQIAFIGASKSLVETLFAFLFISDTLLLHNRAWTEGSKSS